MVCKNIESDADGNMTFDGTLHYKYDAWNRLVQVNADDPENPGQPGDLIAVYQYDGQNQRIRKTVGSTTTEYFFNTNWQVMEERQGSTVTAQYAWDIRYIDTPVCRFCTVNSQTETLYYTNDANFSRVGWADLPTIFAPRRPIDRQVCPPAELFTGRGGWGMLDCGANEI